MRKSEYKPGNTDKNSGRKTNCPKNLYIHIPFCKSKCNYCNFISFTDKNDITESYFCALKKETEFYFSAYSDINLNTLYTGGGTPSVVDIKYYEDFFNILNNFVSFSENAEITMEINPGTVDFNYLKNIRNLGINRLSIGIQSFNDKILKILNRIHVAKEAEKTVKTAKEAGFENISIDLIYGLPGQTLEIWEETLNRALKLQINHISTYGLKIESGTEFSRCTPKNLPDDEAQREFYLKTIEILENNEFNHYEISNFSRKGYESKHNLDCWKNKDYFGFGLNAHGYSEGIRYSNTENLEEYLQNPLKHAFENKLSEPEKFEEAVFLGLRLREGINTEEFKNLYGIDISEKYRRIIEKYVNYGFMTLENNNLRLTPEGVLLSNSILCDFIQLNIA